jgi:hypothetical protein
MKTTFHNFFKKVSGKKAGRDFERFFQRSHDLLTNLRVFLWFDNAFEQAADKRYNNAKQ